jgi:hypothetical protein
MTQLVITIPPAGISALFEVFPGGDLLGEPIACLGVDIQTPFGTPEGELIGIKIDTLDQPALLAQMIEAALGILKPFVEQTGKLLPILRALPDHRDDFGNRGHDGTPVAVALDTTSIGAAGGSVIDPPVLLNSHIEAGKQKRLVEIAAPIEPRKNYRDHRITLLRSGGAGDETYLAPTLACALAVAECLLKGEEVPKRYFDFPNGSLH